MPAQEGMCKVSCVCWSPNNRKLAVVTVDRVVHLFDENGERRDKFSTKPADKTGPKTYIVTSMAFSPDSTKLAVAQSDNIVFVYKLGLNWGDKKSICNKFLQTSSITCLAWPSAHPNEVVFGLADGKVKIGQLRTNKPATLYSTDSFTVTACSSPDGNAILTGHVDGSIYRFLFEDSGRGPSHSRFAIHSCVPYALAWGHSILAGGNDGKVVFYDTGGMLLRTFDYGREDGVKDFTCATFNPSGEAAVVGNFNRFYVYNFNMRAREWDEASVRIVDNLYTVTALAWKQDGSRLALGNLTGVVDLYDACIKRTRYRGKFEFTYVSLSQVIVKRLSTGTRIVLKSTFGYEIMKINIFQDRYLVAHTPETLLMGDLESCKLSEVQWEGTGLERFFFDNASVCMVFNAGELSLIEYGHNELLGACRTEHMNPHLISVRINERPPARSEEEKSAVGGGGGAGGVARSRDPTTWDNKKIAYLWDVQTIRVLDLVRNTEAATISHDAKIDWLELNGRANMVLFRDKRRKLHLYDIAKQTRTTLLNFCNYVQWVPDSDVVVAQNRNNLCVWYNIYAPDKMTNYEIKGDVEEIERGGGKTEVVVDEGINTATYLLDEGLIGFGTAVEDRDYDKAMSILEDLELTPETEAMWQQLSEMALASDELHVAQRCAAALGDVARARFLHKTSKIAATAGEKFGGDGKDFWMVRARMAELRKDLLGAEGILVDQGKLDEAIEMYQTLHRWDDAIALAESRGHPQAAEMRRQFYQYLLDSGQEEKAASLKEAEGDYMTAISLYLKGGYPAKALNIVNSRHGSYGNDLMEKIGQALMTAGMYDKAGALLERMGSHQRALDAYVRGHAFRPAVELARRQFPSQVVGLEQSWGDWLASQKQTDAAINHYIEAMAYTSAINCALNAKMYTKAVQLVDDTLRDPEVARPFYKRIARHFQESSNFNEAERFYVKAGEAEAAVDMYVNAGMWERGHAVASTCMKVEAVNSMYITKAQRLQAEQNYKEAERLYLTVEEPDLAIDMYKKAHQYQDMVRLVTEHRPDLLKDTHLHLAQQLEMEMNLKQAEHHYVEAGEWEAAVSMYRSNDRWDEALRVAKLHDGQDAANRVAYTWAIALGGEAGAKLLTRLGLVEQAIDYAIDTGAWDHAYELARTSMKKKLPDVHLKQALCLEDDGEFKAAEDEFVKAGKPKEAIDMYTHQHNWAAAMRVAETYDPASIPDVLVAQAALAAENKNYARAEAHYVDAKKPESAVRMYMDAHMYPEALRVAKKHVPHQLARVEEDIHRLTTSGGGDSKDSILTNARMWENNRDYSRAITAYLRIQPGMVAPPDSVEDIWEKALALAQTHVRTRYVEVAEDVAQRLKVNPERRARAGDLFKSIELYKEAVDCYMDATPAQFEKAIELARIAAPQYTRYVDEKYKEHLRSTADTGKMISVGDTDAALDMLAGQRKWTEVFELCSKKGDMHSLQKYAFTFMEETLDEGKPVEVVKMFSTYGCPAAPGQFNLFQQLVSDLLTGPISKACDDSVLVEARDVMFKIVSQMRRGDSSSGALGEFERLLLVLHYYALRSVAKEHGLNDIAATLSVSLLRFVGTIPADRAFYEAGTACKVVGWLPMAFVFLNRYLDLIESIEEGDTDGSMIDNSDFVGTDIPSPYDFKLPKIQWLDEEKREDVREWVLSLSMDADVEQELSTRSCEKCGVKTYEGGLHCDSCRGQFPACIVSGYPVPMSQMVQCKSCGSRAHKAYWNKFLVKAKVCPWCHSPQSPVY